MQEIDYNQIFHRARLNSTHRRLRVPLFIHPFCVCVSLLSTFLLPVLIAATVSELEGMVQDQKQLMDKLTAECKSLTHKLEDTSLQHKYMFIVFSSLVERLSVDILFVFFLY